MQSNKCPNSFYLDDKEVLFEYINRKRHEFMFKYRIEPNAVIMDNHYINDVQSPHVMFGFGYRGEYRILGLQVVRVPNIYKPIVCLMEFTD